MEHTSCLHLLAERYKVRLLAFLKSPFLMGPEGTGGSDSGLYFVDNEERAVFFRNQTQRSEKGRRGVFVTALG